MAAQYYVDNCYSLSPTILSGTLMYSLSVWSGIRLAGVLGGRGGAALAAGAAARLAAATAVGALLPNNNT